MFDCSLLKDEVIIISPRNKKNDILLATNPLKKSIKIISKEELVENTFFSYDDRAIIHLMNKGISFNNAQEIIDNLYYVKPINDKLNNLIRIKDELESLGLIYKNELYHHLFINKTVYIYGYSKYDLEIKELLKLNNVENFVYLNDKRIDKKYEVLSFLDIEDEVDFVFNQICSLVDQGVDINKIKIFNVSSEYELVIRKYKELYNLPLNLQNEMTLYSSPYFAYFLTLIDNNSLEEAYKILNKEINKDSYYFLDYLKQLIFDIKDIFNDKGKEKEYLILKAKKIKLPSLKYCNGIDFVDYNYSFDDYIFVLGFNLLSYPKVKKDNTYLNDKEKEKLGINTSFDLNLIEEERLISFLNSHSNLFISYKNVIGKDVYYPSLLIEKLNYKVKDNPKTNIRYSLKSSKIKVSKEKDLKVKYGFNSPFLYALDSQVVDYKTYNHKFKVSKKMIDESQRNFSYSQINTYNRCPFSYFVEKVLKASDFEETFEMKLGTLYHDFLETYLSNQNEVDIEEINTKIIETFSKPNEVFFAKKLINQLLEVIDFNRQFLSDGDELDSESEKTLYVKIDDKSYLKGIIDKLIYSSKNKELIIIDYKTGNTSLEKEKIPYGLSLQLPLYSYLVRNNYPSYIQGGIYIQNVLNNNDKGTPDLKLKGISLFDRNVLSTFDKNLKCSSVRSKYFKGVSISANDELNKTSSTFSKEEIEELVNLSVEQLKNSINGIRKGEYPIRPIFFKKEMTNVCQMCKHHSICFREIEDIYYVDLNKVEEGDEE